MEEAMPQVDPQQEPGQGSFFILALAASLLLHLILSVLFLGGSPSAGSKAPAVSVLDLSMVQPKPPAPLPSVPPQVQHEPRPELHTAPVPDITQVKPQPETAPLAKPEVTPEVKPEEMASVKPEAAPAPAPPTPVPAPTAEMGPPRPVQVVEETTLTDPSSLGLGLTKGYFKSLGNGETLREGVKEYYLAMLQVVNQKWWLDPDVTKGRIAPLMIDLIIARNGEIVDKRVLVSSGNPRYDRAVLAAISAANPLPPLPASYQGAYFEAPIRLVPPLNLLSW